MSNSNDFFKENGDLVMHAKLYGETCGAFKIEEMYQAFKERLIGEMIKMESAYITGELSKDLESFLKRNKGCE